VYTLGIFILFILRVFFKMLASCLSTISRPAAGDLICGGKLGDKGRHELVRRCDVLSVWAAPI